MRALHSVASVVIFFSFFCCSSGAQDRHKASSGVTTEVRGSVVECWQGEKHPVIDVGVYALTMRDSLQIRETIEKIERYNKAHPLGQNDVPGTPFDEELLRKVKALPSDSRRTVTNATGEYRLKNLNVGEKYLVLVIQPNAENELYYRYQTTPKLTQQPQTILFDARSQSPM